MIIRLALGVFVLGLSNSAASAATQVKYSCLLYDLSGNRHQFEAEFGGEVQYNDAIPSASVTLYERADNEQGVVIRSSQNDMRAQADIPFGSEKIRLWLFSASSEPYVGLKCDKI